MTKFKRFLSFTLALIMVVSMTTVGIVSASAEAVDYKLGDANLDTYVNIYDATYIQAHCAGIEEYVIAEGTIQAAAADVNQDGFVNIYDATFVQRYLVGYEDATAPDIEKTFTFGEDDPTQPTDPETQATEPETEAPTATPDQAETEATEPETEATESQEVTAGYYMMGKLDGVEYWDAKTITNDRKLSENPANAGEYTLDWTFVDGDEIKVVYFDGTAIETWYNDGGDNYTLTDKGGKTGECTLYFRPEGNDSWSYFFFTVQPKTTDDPTQAETQKPTQADDSNKLYLDANDWDVDGAWFAAYVWNGSSNKWLTATETETDGIYEVELPDGYSDIIWVRMNKSATSPNWDDKWNQTSDLKVPTDGKNMYVIKGWGESDGNWAVAPIVYPTEETEEPTQEETQAQTDDPATGDQEETEAPDVITEGYYMVGTLNGVNLWGSDTLTADRKLVANPDVAGEYTLVYNFVDGDEIKVVYFDGTGIKTWYQSGGDNNYKLTAEGGKTGECTLSFRPDGNDDWSYFYFTVQPNKTDATEEEPTVKETEAPATGDQEETEAETVEETEAPVTIDAGYYMVGKLNGESFWGADELTADRKLAENPGSEGEYMLKYNFVDGDEIKVVYFDGKEITKWYGDGDNYKLTAEGGKTGPCTLYFRAEGNDSWSYFYFTVIADEVEETEAPTQAVEPETEAPTDAPATGDQEETEEPTVEETEAPVTIEAGYYMVGNLGGVNLWGADVITADRKLAENPGSEGEYMLKYNFVDGDEIKVVYFDGKEITKWYGEGDNYKLTAEGGKTGPCTLYFRSEGNDSWSYFYFTVIADKVEETEAPTQAVEPETEAPTDAPASDDQEETEEPTEEPTVEETEAPVTIEAGYYMVGKLNGESFWDAKTLTADRKLAENPGSEGEYMLKYNFVDGDEIKVVYFDGTAIKTWYNDGGDNYSLTDKGGKTGPCTLYFRAEGNDSWSYFYFTVIADKVEETEAPTEEPEVPTATPDQDETEAPTQAPTEAFSKTAYCINSAGWDKLAAHSWIEGGAGTTWPGKAMTKTDMSVNGFDVYSVTFTVDYDNIIFNNNNNGSQTDNLKFMAGQYYDVKTSTWYASLDDVPEVDTSATNVYLAGEFNGWSTTKNEFKISEANSTVGYISLELAANTKYEFKVVDNGTWMGNGGKITESITGWTFKNSDGSNCTMTTAAAGTYVFAFDTATDKVSITYPADQTEAPTQAVEPETEAPTDAPASDDQEETEEPTVEETEAPVEVEAGYYMVGNLGGVNLWGADALTADRKLAENPGSEGEYMLKYTFTAVDEIKVVYFDGKEITKWYGEGDNYTIGEKKVGACTLYFRAEGNDSWSYFYFTVIKDTVEETEAPTQAVEPETEAPTEEPTVEETEAPTEEPTVEETEAPTAEPTEEPTVEETEAPVTIEAGYYMVGKLNGESFWDANTLTADRKLAENPGSEGEYMLKYNFVDGDEIKVVYFDGTAIKTWYNDGGDNYSLTDKGGKTGPCTLYFRAEGNDSWSYFYFTVIKDTVEETEAPTQAVEPETEAPTEEPTVEETEAETVEPTVEETEAETEEPTVEETEEPTEEPTVEETEAPVTIEAGYYMVGNLGGVNLWGADALTADRKLAENPGSEGEYMLKYTFTAVDEIKVVYFDGKEITKWYSDGDNYTIGEKKVGACTLYFRSEGNDSWSYFYFTVIKDTVEETEAPTQAETQAPTVEETEAPTQAPTEAPDVVDAGYYMVGKLNGVSLWGADDLTVDRKLVANPNAAGEYTLDYTFVDGDEIKVVYFDGKGIAKWYGDGDNYKLTDKGGKTGPCTLYFRPEGKDGWTYKYFTVKAK